ncbi:hypothetical protein [Propionivibrio sp.]|uniref:hypothetical protein n=1 Tax=Propionivibrio sp. TaxID=2212460 RepID=UPI0025F699FF|nr:hypothetical protein [Propionivibrio sp.]MBK8400802.1 hypothetical protein [Propionivibrio sp.]MBK8744828.1 hypothetical protein [Propionivibrio sp.]MBL0207832.1 hypothetical protein [Propionivibrio sp.]
MSNYQAIDREGLKSTVAAEKGGKLPEETANIAGKSYREAAAKTYCFDIPSSTGKIAG